MGAESRLVQSGEGRRFYPATHSHRVAHASPPRRNAAIPGRQRHDALSRLGQDLFCSTSFCYRSAPTGRHCPLRSAHAGGVDHGYVAVVSRRDRIENAIPSRPAIGRSGCRASCADRSARGRRATVHRSGTAAGSHSEPARHRPAAPLAACSARAAGSPPIPHRSAVTAHLNPLSLEASSKPVSQRIPYWHSCGDRP